MCEYHQPQIPWFEKVQSLLYSLRLSSTSFLMATLTLCSCTLTVLGSHSGYSDLKLKTFWIEQKDAVPAESVSMKVDFNEDFVSNLLQRFMPDRKQQSRLRHLSSARYHFGHTIPGHPLDSLSQQSRAQYADPPSALWASPKTLKLLLRPFIL